MNTNELMGLLVLVTLLRLVGMLMSSRTGNTHMNVFTAKRSDMNDWREWIRLLTPVGIFVIGLYIAQVNGNITDVKEAIAKVQEQLFHHLTNDDIHTPKNIVVSQAEFKVYQEMRATQMETLSLGITELKELLREHDRLTRGKK